MTIDKRLARYKQAVDRELERVLSRTNTLLFQAMRHSVLGGGKRYRPLLFLSAAEAFAPQPSDGGRGPGHRPGVHFRRTRPWIQATGEWRAEGSSLDFLPFACALEFIHNYSLIHDDLPCMDDDDVRRGRPTCHKEFGEDIALLAGDGLLTMAFELMAGADVPRRLQARKIQVIRETAELAGAEGMIGGQLLDITFSAENATEASLAELMLKKTGALITASVRAGALLGGASAASIKAVTVFGENIGLAFQIRDDLHDAAERPRKGAAAGPNYARAFGVERARDRLRFFVGGGLAALEKSSVKAPLLRRLAEQLLP